MPTRESSRYGLWKDTQVMPSLSTLLITKRSGQGWGDSRKEEEMNYGPLVGTSSAAVKGIPKATFERWKAWLRSRGNVGVEVRLRQLIEKDLQEHWNDELEAAFRKVFGIEG